MGMRGRTRWWARALALGMDAPPKSRQRRGGARRCARRANGRTARPAPTRPPPPGQDGQPTHLSAHRQKTPSVRPPAARSGARLGARSEHGLGGRGRAQRGTWGALRQLKRLHSHADMPWGPHTDRPGSAWRRAPRPRSVVAWRSWLAFRSDGSGSYSRMRPKGEVGGFRGKKSRSVDRGRCRPAASRPSMSGSHGATPTTEPLADEDEDVP